MTRTTTWRSLAAVAAASLALTACGTTADDDPGGDDTGGDDTETGGDPAAGGEPACDLDIAYVGPLTGPYANLGINIQNGAELAVQEFTEANADCAVELVPFDSQGDPAVATPLVTEIIGNEDIVGVVGPTFSGETDATGAAFAEAGLVTVSPSATNPELSANGWDTFHRLLGNDATQAPAAAAYMRDTLGAEQIMVIDDASEYGAGLAAGITEDLGDLAVGTETVQQGQTDFSATVTAVTASGADAVYFAGYYAEAGLLASQLQTGGFEGTFLSGDGSLDPGFVEGAGAAGDGAILTCPCAPATGEFATAYEELAGSAPGTYSAEGYDAANVLLQGLLAGNGDRESMLEWVNNYNEEGITKQIQFDETGEVAEVVVYAYTVEGGEIQPGEPIEMTE